MRSTIYKLKKHKCYVLILTLLLMILLLFIIFSAAKPSNLKLIDIEQEGYCSDNKYLNPENVDNFANVYNIYEKDCVLNEKIILTVAYNSFENQHSIIIPNNNAYYRTENIATSNNVKICIYVLTNVSDKKFIEENINIALFENDKDLELCFVKKDWQVKGLYIEGADNRFDAKVQYYILIKNAEEK